MNAQEAEAIYRTLRRQLDGGTITREQFSSKVNDLRYQDNQGDWWQIRAEDGTWMQWTGSAWETPPTVLPDTTQKSQSVAQHETGSWIDSLKARKLVAVSVVSGALSFLIAPYFLGIIAMITGGYSAMKDKLGIVGALLGLGGMVFNFFYIYIF